MITIEQIRDVLAQPSEFAAYQLAEKISETLGEAILLHWMHQLKADRAGGWPFIERAISRGMPDVAAELTHCYWINNHGEFSKLIDRHDLRHMTEQEQKAAWDAHKAGKP